MMKRALLVNRSLRPPWPIVRLGCRRVAQVGVSSACVVDDARAVGVITRVDLFDHEGPLDGPPEGYPETSARASSSSKPG